MKVACTVLRGAGCSDAPRLPDDALSAHVRKGEKGSLVVYADTFRKTETDQNTGEETEKDIPFLKSYTVFNVEQIEGLPPAY
jgi:antirestriction protein ArdC